jgi:hypothetical protein
MPTIVNAYKGDTTLGDTISQLGAGLFGKKALEGDLLREKTYGLRRNNDSVDEFQRQALRGPVDFNNPRIQAATYGAESPKDLLQAHLGVMANSRGAMDPKTTNASAALGGNYAATGQGFATDQANRMTIANMQADKAAQTAIRTAEMTPINIIDPVTKQPRIVSRAEAIRSGAVPVLNASDVEGTLKFSGYPSGYKDTNPQQQKAAGVLVPADHLYNWQAAGPNDTILSGRTTEGRTDMTTGQPIPAEARVIGTTNAGGPNVMTPLAPATALNTHLQEKYLNNQDLVSYIDRAKGMLAANPNAVGAVGVGQQAVQRARLMGEQIATALGKGRDFRESVDKTRAEITSRIGANGAALVPELYNPAMDDVQGMYGVMVYQTAKALFGQEGRGLNLPDVNATRQLLGNPASLFTNPQELSARLDLVRSLAAGHVANSAAILKSRNITALPNGAPAASAQPVQRQPAAPEVWGRDPATGQPVRQQ